MNKALKKNAVTDICQLECNVTSILFHARSQIVAQLQCCDWKAGLQLCWATVLSSRLQGALNSSNHRGLWGCACVHASCMFKSGCLCSVAWSCLTLCDPMDCQTPLSMEFSRQKYWSGLLFPSSFVIIIILVCLRHNGLPLCLTVELKCFCSGLCPPIDGRKGKINPSTASGLPF